MKPKFKGLWLPVAYYLSWGMFGLGSLGLNFVCAVLMLWPNRQALRPWCRKATRFMFEQWIGWLELTGVAKVTWTNFEQPIPRGVVVVANHPSLIDATLLLARLPDTVCIFKPALMRNPVIAPAAVMSGYLRGDLGIDLIRNAADEIRGGTSLLIFPEGTRSVGGCGLNPLKPGFAIISQRAEAPVQVIHIRCTPGALEKNRDWWRLPVLPIRFEFTLGPLLAHDSGRSIQDWMLLVSEKLTPLATNLPVS